MIMSIIRNYKLEFQKDENARVSMMSCRCRIWFCLLFDIKLLQVVETGKVVISGGYVDLFESSSM